MATVRTPRTIAAATKLLERFAELDGQIAAIEEQRKVELADVNAEADRLIAPFLPERDAILAKLQGWWVEAAPGLTDGKRKSIALGGCEIGSRSSPATLGVAGDEKLIAKALIKLRWARELVRVTIGIDRAAVLKSIDGVHAAQLAELGFSRVAGGEAVFVRRVRQDGTLGGS
jgi:hypothetical protein